MADATDQERTNQNRFAGDGSKKRPYVMLMPGTRGGFEALIVQPPDEIVFEEERPITPSQEFRSQEVRQQAESVLSKAAKGQHFKDDYLKKLQQQLGTSGGAISNDLRALWGNFELRRRRAARNLRFARQGRALLGSSYSTAITLTA